MKLFLYIIIYLYINDVKKYSYKITFIIYLQDHIFMIKVITTEEVEQMHYLLKYYHPYVVEQHGKTLLPQFLGKYTSARSLQWAKNGKNSTIYLGYLL